MKDINAKKKSFVNSSLGVVIVRILSIIYVVPFFAVIGEQGGALYSYAYTIYALFMSFAITGIPLAVSRLVNEYQTLGYYSVKKRVFIIGKKFALLLGFICFLILVLCAPLFAKYILGDLVGGNSMKDIIFVIRAISIAMLIFPLLSIYRGYFEGHRMLGMLSISKTMEQIISILLIVLGSYFSLKIFKFSLTSTVGFAVFAIFVGLFGSLIYLINKLINNKKKFDEKARNVNEPIITDKMILKKLVVYALPFILIDVLKSLYNFIDIGTVVKGLVNLGDFSVSDAEAIMGMLSIWASIFNIIIIYISTCVVVSLIPSLTQSVTKKDRVSINKKINQALCILLFLVVPIIICISFLAEPIWVLFYGSNMYGPSVLSYFIFVGLVMTLFMASISILQVFKDYKTIFVSLITGLILKIFLNINLIETFYKLGIPAYYGVITASIVSYLVSFIICLIILYVKYKVDYEMTVKYFLDVLCGCMLMVIVLFLMKFFVPIISVSRIVNLFIICLYLIVGTLVYFVFMKRIGVINDLFGKKSIDEQNKK